MSPLIRSRWTMPLGSLVLLVVAGACSVLPESEPVQLLDPQLPGPAGVRDGVSWSLDIPRPEADPVRDSTRVLVRTGEGQLQVHASARWVAAAPELFRTLLVRHLRDAGGVVQVATGAGGLDRTLALDLRRFELTETPRDGLEAEIRVEARLYDNASAGLLARHLFQARQSAPSSRPDHILSAFEGALGAIIPTLADWVTSRQPATPAS